MGSIEAKSGSSYMNILVVNHLMLYSVCCTVFSLVILKKFSFLFSEGFSTKLFTTRNN